MRTLVIEIKIEIKTVKMAAKKTKKPELDAPKQILLSIKPLKQVEESAPERIATSQFVDHSPQVLCSNAIFTAVGMITGVVSFSDDGKAAVALGEKNYPLYYLPNRRYAYDALKKEIAAVGSKQRLIVYPKVLHFSKKQPHQIGFYLVGFDSGRKADTVASALKDFEFRLCGLWQFIPVCQLPCVSIFRNFSRDRLELIKKANMIWKVRFMKATHIPLIWKDSPVRPFRFNPKLPVKEQGHSSFVEVITKFLPGRDVFEFSHMLSEPMETAPPFLKASKRDKIKAMQTRKVR